MSRDEEEEIEEAFLDDWKTADFGRNEIRSAVDNQNENYYA